MSSTFGIYLIDICIGVWAKFTGPKEYINLKGSI